MVRHSLVTKVVVIKIASQATTPGLATAGNGATKEHAPEVVLVLGRLPTLRRRKEAEPEVPVPTKGKKQRVGGKEVRGDK